MTASISSTSYGRSDLLVLNPVARPWTYWVVVCYVVLTPWIVVPLPFGVSLGASDLLFLFAIIALVREAVGGRGAARVLLLLFIASAYFSTVMVTAANGFVDTQQVLTLTRAVAVLMPFFVAVAHGPFSLRQRERLLNLLLISGMAAMLLGWVFFRLGIKVRDTQQTLWNAPGNTTLRAGGLLGNSSSFGSLAAVLAVAAIALAVTTGKRRGWTAVMVALCASAIVIASSRASLLDLFVVLVVLVPVFFRGRAVLAVILIIAVVVGVLALGVAAANVSQGTLVATTLDRLDFLNISGSSTFYQSGTRLSSWQTMAQLFQQHWAWGIGYNNTVAIVGNAGDNSFISPFVELGIASGILFLLFWLSVGTRLVTSNDRLVRWVGAALWAGATAQMLTVDAYREWSSTPILMAVLGILCVSSPAQPDTTSSLPSTRIGGGRARWRERV